MKGPSFRRGLLTALAAGVLPASGCDIAGAVLETIRLALSIADVWA